MSSIAHQWNQLLSYFTWKTTCTIIIVADSRGPLSTKWEWWQFWLSTIYDAINTMPFWWGNKVLTCRAFILVLKLILVMSTFAFLSSTWLAWLKQHGFHVSIRMICKQATHIIWAPLNKAWVYELVNTKKVCSEQIQPLSLSPSWQWKWPLEE